MASTTEKQPPKPEVKRNAEEQDRENWSEVTEVITPLDRPAGEPDEKEKD